MARKKKILIGELIMSYDYRQCTFKSKDGTTTPIYRENEWCRQNGYTLKHIGTGHYEVYKTEELHNVT